MMPKYSSQLKEFKADYSDTVISRSLFILKTINGWNEKDKIMSGLILSRGECGVMFEWPFHKVYCEICDDSYEMIDANKKDYVNITYSDRSIFLDELQGLFKSLKF